MKTVQMSKSLLIGLFFLGLSWNCQSDDTATKGPEDPPVEEGIKKIDYQVSQQVFTNPERGFMHTWQVFSEGSEVDPTALMALKGQHVSLILRLYYFDQFKDSPLSEAQLTLIRNDMDHFREAGVKCVLRFAYTDDQNGTDAPLDVIEAHLEQLGPIFTEHADVIAFIQAGFIGAWGEWYYSSNGLDNLASRKAVVEKLLEVAPESIKIQVRTPLYKQQIFGYDTAIGTETGYGTGAKARVGFHNDCFLASTTDYGTYQDVEAEKRFISKEALFVPTGGETCPPVDIPLADCATARTEMELLKWTYLNLDYYGPVLDGWRNANCFEDFQRRLGYRLALKSAELKEEATDTFVLKLKVDNLGFAPVYNKKDAFLVLRSKTDASITRKALALDVRKIVPKNTFDLQENINVSDVPPGEYELFLELADAHGSLAARPEYKIQLANANVWESETGFNNVNHTLTIK